MEHAKPLPRFDIHFALVHALVWHRYRKRIDSRLRESHGTVYFKAVCEHATRLQRYAEGFVAFCTTGVQEEVRWLSRPCLELFASQCLLQFAHVSHPEKRAMTNEEKADAFYSHSKYVQLQLLQDHPSWKEHDLSTDVRQTKISELELELSAKPWRFSPNKPWHLGDLENSFCRGLKARDKKMGGNNAAAWNSLMPLMKDYINNGLHGSAFSATFMHKHVSDGVDLLVDDRRPALIQEWLLPCLIAAYSLEMLAYEFGEAHLIDPMLKSADSELANNPSRYVNHFPTALIALS